MNERKKKRKVRETSWNAQRLIWNFTCWTVVQFFSRVLCIINQRCSKVHVFVKKVVTFSLVPGLLWTPQSRRRVFDCIIDRHIFIVNYKIDFWIVGWIEIIRIIVWYFDIGTMKRRFGMNARRRRCMTVMSIKVTTCEWYNRKNRKKRKRKIPIKNGHWLFGAVHKKRLSCPVWCVSRKGFWRSFLQEFFSLTPLIPTLKRRAQQKLILIL